MEKGKGRALASPSSPSGIGPNARISGQSHLSNVVSNLVRASLGQDASSRIPADLTGEELDRYVADMIVQETAAASTVQDGRRLGGREAMKATDEQPRIAQTNKRFLSNLIRNTDSHNQAVIRHLKREALDGQDERRAASRDDLRNDASGRRLGKLRAWDAEDESRLLRGSDRPLAFADTRGPAPSFPKTQRPSRPHEKTKVDELPEALMRRKRQAEMARVNRASTSTSRSHDWRDRSEVDGSHRSRAQKRSRSRSVSRSPPICLPGSKGTAYSSKMDKYFAKDYDPRLDIPDNTVDSLTDPQTGLIEDGGWDEMLSVIREKEDLRKQRKRQEKEARRLARRKRKEEGRERERGNRSESDSDDGRSEGYGRETRSSRQKDERGVAPSHLDGLQEGRSTRKRHRSHSTSPTRSTSRDRRRQAKIRGYHDDRVTIARRRRDSSEREETADPGVGFEGVRSRGLREWDMGKAERRRR